MNIFLVKVKNLIKSEKGYNFLYRGCQVLIKQLFGLFIYYYSAYQLNPETFGELVFLLTISSVIVMFSDLGLSISTSKSVTEMIAKGGSIKDCNKILFSVLIFISVFVVILLMLLILTKGIFFNEKYYDSVLRLIPYVYFTPLVGVLDGYFWGLKKFRILALSNLIVFACTIPVSVFLISTYLDLGTINSLNLFSILLFLLLLFKVKPLKFTFDLPVLKKTLKYGIVIAISSFAYFLYTRVDIFILESYNFSTEIGYYEIVNRLLIALFLPFIIFAQTMAPHTTTLVTQEKFKELHDKVFKHSIIITGLGILCMLIFWFGFPIIIKNFFPEYYSPNFNQVVTVLVFIIPFKILGVYTTNAFITPIGLAKITMVVTLIFGFLNVILDYVFINLYGFIGIFWATLVVHNLAIIFQYVLFIKKLKKL